MVGGVQSVVVDEVRPVGVDESIEAQAISPAVGEVGDVHPWISEENTKVKVIAKSRLQLDIDKAMME